MNKCVFLDRDGVINQEKGYYVYEPRDFILHEGVKDALAYLRAQGFLLIVITNQGGIAKGKYTHAQVQATHAHMQNLLGNMLQDAFYSPYHEAVTLSLSRKPSGYMIERAMALYNIDYRQSWMVGNQTRDIQAGQGAGVRTLFIGQGAHVADVSSPSLQLAMQQLVGPFAI